MFVSLILLINRGKNNVRKILSFTKKNELGEVIAKWFIFKELQTVERVHTSYIVETVNSFQNSSQNISIQF